MGRSRRDFMKTMGYGAAGMSLMPLMSCINVSKGKERPNILFIMSDDHAEQAISCYGNSPIETPNIDRIAHEGIRFNNSFVTNSICAPSRATILTGKYSHNIGLRDNRDVFDGSQLTFPKLLQEADYGTSLIGKWHLKTTPAGFDRWEILRGQGQYYNPVFYTEEGETKYTGYTTDIITDRALNALENRDASRPFCMMVQHKAPHRNWMPDIKHLQTAEDVEAPVPDTFYDDYETRSAAAEEADMRIDDMFLSFDLKLHPDAYQQETGTGGNVEWARNAPETWEATYNRLTPEQKKAWDAYYDEVNEEFKSSNFTDRELSEWKYQRYINDYLKCVISLDENIGRLLKYLDENDLSDNTIVVYTSDQGFYLGEHGWYDKRFMYEESLSMPLVMRYPGTIPAGQVSDEIVLNLDFAPTFLEFAGAAIPGEMQGRSMRPLMTGPGNIEWRDSMYYHYYEYPHGWHDVKRHYGIRTQRYKLIHFYHDIDAWELYDLENDPNEVANLYDHPEYQTVVEKLKIQLRSLQQKYGDTDIEYDE